MNDENIKSHCLYLTSSPIQQIMYVLKTISKDHLHIILEILYNIVNGVLAISNEDKQKFKKHKTILRKLIAPNLEWTSRKKLLWKIKHLVPIIIQNYVKYVKRTRVNSEEEI